jgi:hypothetical protein
LNLLPILICYICTSGDVLEGKRIVRIIMKTRFLNQKNYKERMQAFNVPILNNNGIAATDEIAFC